DQRVPSTSAGGGLQWSHRFGTNLLSAGGDARWVKGETDERVYNAGAFVRTRDAGGQQFIGGIFLQDVYTPIPALELVGGVRSDVTVANESLRPEQLTGGELGVQQRWGPFEGRITGYWNDVHDLVANVTLTSRLPDCPAGTTCRQRQNLDLARIRGFETELELRPARDWRFLVSYLFVDARVVNAPQQPGLEGNRLAQVPENSVTATVRFSRPSWFDASVTARYIGPQYEDDLNTLPLGGYFVMDAMVSRAITRNVELYVAAENIFDRVYTTGRTTDGVISIGEPFMVRGGVRLRF